MRLPLACALATVAGLASAAAARPAISTMFTGGNSGSAGGGVYYQIVVGANPIQITGFDVNTTAVAGTALPFRVFTAAGTHAGNEANPGAWTLQSTGSGIATGPNTPNPITLANSFVLAANTSYGIAITLSSASGTPAPASNSYTNGNGTNQQFSNGDLTLNLGTATNILFSGSAFSPRVFNGTVYYNVIPAPGALALLGLGGLAAARRRR